MKTSYALSEMSIRSTNVTSMATVVASYFRFNRSKHNHDEYNTWMTNFFESVQTTPLVIFTDELNKDFIAQKRAQRPTKIIVYESVWKLMAELEVVRNKAYIENYKTKQHGQYILGSN